VPRSPAKLSPDLKDTQWIAPAELRFDEKNPRLSARHADAPDQQAILEVLWREFAVDEVALSIATNGFFPYEPVFVVDEVLPSTGKRELIVVEGNRRLAAVRLLADPTLRRTLKATDLPPTSAAVKPTLERLPVIRCERDEIWRFVGFKHVNGPQPWDALSKAEYIAWVHNDLGAAPVEGRQPTIGSVALA
jgi:hypothetical protein